MIKNLADSSKRFKLERRTDVSIMQKIAALLIALVASIGITALIIAAAGADPKEALTSLLMGAVSDRRAFMDSLIAATPLILTGIAVVIAYRGGVFTIGAEGQFFAGAMTAYWAYLTFSGLPRLPLIIIILVAAAIGGAICGGIAALLKAYFEVDVIITTVMLNYIVLLLLSYLLSVGMPWKDPDSFAQGSRLVEEVARLPILVEGSRLHLGFLIGILACIVVYIILKKSPLGFEIRAVGLNSIASHFRGISTVRVLMTTMLISGAMAGLAGAGELFGLQHRLKGSLSSGFGYTGILVAVLANLDPIGVIPAAFLFGALSQGAIRMQVKTGVATSLVFAIQALILLIYVASQALVTYRVRIVEND
jgi:general nucleoside transport system permease protein